MNNFDQAVNSWYNRRWPGHPLNLNCLSLDTFDEGTRRHIQAPDKALPQLRSVSLLLALARFFWRKIKNCTVVGKCVLAFCG